MMWTSSGLSSIINIFFESSSNGMLLASMKRSNSSRNTFLNPPPVFMHLNLPVSIQLTTVFAVT